MPRTRSLAWSELKIGVLTIVALVITVLTIFLLTGSRGFFWQRYNLKTQFTNVAGLKSGSPVMVAGVEKGTVTDVELTGEVVDVTFEVNKDMQDRITTASSATLGSVSLLGGAAVEITPALKGRRFRSGATCRPAGAGAILRPRHSGQRGRPEDQRADRGHPQRARHGRQADDRRSAVPGADRFMATAGAMTGAFRRDAGRSAS